MAYFYRENYYNIDFSYLAFIELYLFVTPLFLYQTSIKIDYRRIDLPQKNGCIKILFLILKIFLILCIEKK